MSDAFDPVLRRLDWAPRLALGVLAAAGTVFVLQLWLYHNERQTLRDREDLCRSCSSDRTD